MLTDMKSISHTKNLSRSNLTIPSRRLTKMRTKAYRAAMMESSATLRIATQVRLLRERANLSQTQLARAIGTRQSAIARIESGGYGRFSRALLHRIANYFDVATWVEFVSFSTFLQRTDNLSPDVLTPTRYTEEFDQEGEPTTDVLLQFDGSAISGSLYCQPVANANPSRS